MLWRIISGGINLAGLQHASWLLFWLFITAAALYVGVMYALELIGMIKLPLSISRHFKMLHLHDSMWKARRGLTKGAPMTATLVVGYVLGSAQLFNPVREFHNVAVLSKDADRVYTVKFEEYPKPITIRLCSEGDDLPICAGMIIDPFQFIQQKDCLLINYKTFVDWHRNPRRDVVDASNKLLFAKEN